eukprot:278158-Rhodomonas_salina.1
MRSAEKVISTRLEARSHTPLPELVSVRLMGAASRRRSCSASPVPSASSSTVSSVSSKLGTSITHRQRAGPT